VARKQDLITPLFQRNTFFKPFKQQLVTLDRPEELFGKNQIEEAYAGYEFV
jgi:hypothetical protein